MPLDRIRTDTLSLIADGKEIQIKAPSKRNFELNKALLDTTNFRDFVTDPASFAARYDLQIDASIAGQLSEKLAGLGSIGEIDLLRDPNHVATTAWAVAAGAYSVASAKVAVAF